MKEKNTYFNYRSKIKTIIWITIAWTAVSLFQFATGYAIVNDLDCNIDQISASIYFRGSLITGILAGVIGGSGVVFMWEKWLRTKKYLSALFNIFLSYTVVYFLVALPSRLYFRTQEMGLSIYNKTVWYEVLAYQLKWNTFQNYLYWLLVVMATILLLQINDKYGPGVLLDFIKGKYFHPQREERIFMFLDLRSSTTIAEKLGEGDYFNFLNDTFRQATPPILKTKGEIYQYVGDEIVVSWKMSLGLIDGNCIQCFNMITDTLNKNRNYFKNRYQVIPEFKAGLHYGYVMAGEIGVVKRDIVFSGDVLNTTARIQSKCNELSVDLLLSELLVNRLKNYINIQPTLLGKISLKGKQAEIPLYTI